MNYHTRLVDLAGTRSYLNDLRNRVWQIGGGKMPEQRAGAGEKVRVIIHFSASNEIDPDFRGHSPVLTKKIAWRRSEPVWSER